MGRSIDSEADFEKYMDQSAFVNGGKNTMKTIRTSLPVL